MMHDEMNKLLTSELSAIETYQQVLEKKGTDRMGHLVHDCHGNSPALW